MGVVNTMKRMGKTGVIAAAMAELQKEKVKEATAELKRLYALRDKARKALRNVEREIQDYLEELEVDEEDAADDPDTTQPSS